MINAIVTIYDDSEEKEKFLIAPKSVKDNGLAREYDYEFVYRELNEDVLRRKD